MGEKYEKMNVKTNLCQPKLQFMNLEPVGFFFLYKSEGPRRCQDKRHPEIAEPSKPYTRPYLHSRGKSIVTCFFPG